MSIERRLSAVLSEFARTLLTDLSIESILDHLVLRIVHVLPVSGAGVTLISPGVAPRLIAGSDPLALRFEGMHGELNEGPGILASSSGDAVSVHDLRNDDRFPRFSARAVEQGLAAVFAFPLKAGDHQIGALDLYQTTAGSLPEDVVDAAQTLADVAAAYLVIAQARFDLDGALKARMVAEEPRRRLPEQKTLRIGPLKVDLEAGLVTAEDRPIDLTTKEFGLLAFLAARPGHTFSRAELLRAVWQSSSDRQQNDTVTEHIRRLRTKIEPNPRRPQMLKTIRGAGYRLDLPSPGTFVAGDKSFHLLEVGVAVHVEGRIVAADATTIEILGYANEDDVLGKDLLDFVASVSHDAAAERFMLTRGDQARRSEMMTFKRLDGNEVIVEVGSSTITWEGQRAGRVELFVSADPSSRLRHLVTGVHSELSDAVIVTDLHFHVRSWNGAAERLYGWTEQEVLGRHLLDFVGWEGDELASGATNLEITGRWHAEGRQRTRDGSLIDAISSMTMMRDESGDVIGIVFVNRPVLPLLDQRDDSVFPDVSDLRRGFDAQEFEVYFQPAVALADGTIMTVEALVRWQHPDRGLLRPDAFIEIAERNGLIFELDAFVLDTASRQVAAWRAGGVDVGLSINVSAAELADPELVDRTIMTIGATGLDPHALWIEVTETSLVLDVDQAAAVLHRLADYGIGIAIDDFGTGWASLTYLSKFPIHALKIDRIFVAGIVENVNDRAIVKSIVNLGAELGLVVVAEGIETVAQCEAVVALGCLIGQGYLFGRPTPADAVPLHRFNRLEATDGEPSPPGSTGAGPFALREPAVTELSAAPTEQVQSDAGPGLHAARPERRPTATGLGLPPRVVEASEVGALPKPVGGQPDEHQCVSGMLRGLLRVRTSEGAVELLQQTVLGLGGRLVLASENDTDALPLDVSLGEGPPMLAAAEPFSVARMQLERALPRLVEDARQTIDLLRRAERLIEERNQDLLTGLANRRVLDRLLPRIDAGVIVMVDLDHFKAVNDGGGHAAGDAVLARFGQMLANEVRTSDTICRVGGEEFVIVLPRANVAAATELVDRIRAAWVIAAPLPVTFSAGMASVSDLGGTAALLAADQAMYLAKSNGRNRTEVAADQNGRG